MKSQKEVLDNYKNLHKMWNGKRWKLEYVIIIENEGDGRILENTLDDTYAVFKFDKNEKLIRSNLWVSSFDWEGKHYSYTREDVDFYYDELVESNGKFRFDRFEWKYPYLTEIFCDENGAKLFEYKLVVEEVMDYVEKNRTTTFEIEPSEGMSEVEKIQFLNKIITERW